MGLVDRVSRSSYLEAPSTGPPRSPLGAVVAMGLAKRAVTTPDGSLATGSPGAHACSASPRHGDAATGIQGSSTTGRKAVFSAVTPNFQQQHRG